jgi:hypothetical protein
MRKADVGPEAINNGHFSVLDCLQNTRQPGSECQRKSDIGDFHAH